jgi:hypothetical protein
MHSRLQNAVVAVLSVAATLVIQMLLEKSPNENLCLGKGFGFPPATGNSERDSQQFSRAAHSVRNVTARSFVYSILTSKSRHKTHIVPLLETWGKHVDIAFIASDASDLRVSEKIIDLKFTGKKLLGRKVMAMMKAFCSYDADFYVMVDDDTFIVQHNFEYIMSERLGRPREVEWYAGAKLSWVLPPFVAGGSGIILSRATMNRFCPLASNSSHLCSHSFLGLNHAGDLALSECMAFLGIPVTHVPELQINTLEKLLPAGKSDPTDTGFCETIRTLFKGPDVICPPMPTTAAWHYVKGKSFHIYYYWTYLYRNLVPPAV